MRQKRLIALASLLALPMLICAAPPPAYEPTASYHRQEIEGWTVYFSSALDGEQSALAEKVRQVLRVKLFEITRVVPPAALVELRKVPLWVERADHDIPGACYHPSRDWLSEHGYNPDKAGGVEFGNADNFLTWSLDQPWMVLHELAHSYHDRVLGFDNAEVKAAYQQAVESHKYEKVLHFDGRTVRAYALTDPQEYFAESSEAYFGANDFYPFVHSELKTYDPGTFKLLEKMWHSPTRHPATQPASQQSQ